MKMKIEMDMLEINHMYYTLGLFYDKLKNQETPKDFETAFNNQLFIESFENFQREIAREYNDESMGDYCAESYAKRMKQYEIRFKESIRSQTIHKTL
jgi:hypothetical protein